MRAHAPTTWVSRWSRSAYLAAVATALPAAVTILYVQRFGVNVPYADSWNGTLPVLRAFATGHLSLALLWVPHNENRMLFPNLLQAVLDNATGLNSKVDMYVGAGFLIAASGVLTWLARRTSEESSPALLLVPFVMMSLVQYGNLLWAFQVAWFMVLLCWAASLACLERGQRAHTIFYFLGACLFAIVGSGSSLQGLIVWPSGLVYLACSGCSRWRAAAWAALGVVSGLVYIWQFPAQFLQPSLPLARTHPYVVALFVLHLVGAVFPSHPGAFGLLLMLSLLFGLGAAMRAGVSMRELRLPLAAATFAVLFDGAVTVGRLRQAAPLASRYTTYNLLLLVALCLISVAVVARTRAGALGSAGSRLRLGLAVAPVAVGLCLLEVGWALPFAVSRGVLERAQREHAAMVLRDYRVESDAELAGALFPPSGGYVRKSASWLAARHWSVFAIGDSERGSGQV